MIYVRLILFSIRQLSLLGHWQAGAELVGGEVLRHRADRHRYLQIQAAMALRAQLRADLMRLAAFLAALTQTDAHQPEQLTTPE